MGNLAGKACTRNSVFAVMKRSCWKGWLVPPPYLDEHVLSPPYREERLVTPPCREDRLVPPPCHEERLVTPPYREESLLVLLIIGHNTGLKGFDLACRGLVVLLRG